jgi:hypothetical protein
MATPLISPLPPSLIGAQDELRGLLDWSHHLDYAHYTTDWTSAACTLGSEAFVLPPGYGAPPPAGRPPAPDVSLPAAMAAAGVPLPPFKGGATAASASAPAVKPVAAFQTEAVFSMGR